MRTRKFVKWKEIKDRGHSKIKCEVNQALVMFNLYVKFNLHSGKAKQVIVISAKSD